MSEKSVTEGQIVYNSIYMRYLKVVKFIETERIMVARDMSEEVMWSYCLIEFKFCKMQNVHPG